MRQYVRVEESKRGDNRWQHNGAINHAAAELFCHPTSFGRATMKLEQRL